MDRSPLGRLPVELRLAIAEMTWDPDGVDINKRSAWESTRAAYNLAKTCKQLYGEAMPVFLSCNVFTSTLNIYQASQNERVALWDVIMAGRFSDTNNNLDAALHHVAHWLRNLGPAAKKVQAIELAKRVPISQNLYEECLESLTSDVHEVCYPSWPGRVPGTPAASICLRKIKEMASAKLTIKFNLACTGIYDTGGPIQVPMEFDLTSAEALQDSVDHSFKNVQQALQVIDPAIGPIIIDYTEELQDDTLGVLVDMFFWRGGYVSD